MMKLYYCPPAVSIAPLIAALELGLDITLEYVDLETKTTKSGEDFFTVNPKGLVPVLELDNGEKLTETLVILQYIAGLKPNAGLNAAVATPDYYRMLEWMVYFASEIHKLFTLLFWEVDDGAKQEVARRILQKFDFIETALAGKDYLVSNRYSIADLYLYAVIRGLHLIDVDMATYPRVMAFKERMERRPAVVQALGRHSAS